MNIKTREKPLKNLSLSLFVLVFSGCITLKDEIKCSVAGVMSAGSICAHTNSDKTLDLSFNETLDFISAQTARHCVPVGHWRDDKKEVWVTDLNICRDDQTEGIAADLPERGGAISVQADDDNRKKIEIEIMCRMLGNKCKYEIMK